MNAKAVPKEQAMVVLIGEAYVTFYDVIDQARAKFGLEHISGIAANANRCLKAALAGIDEWLDAVYERGLDPEEADFCFLGNSDAVTGLGHSAPSKVIERELGPAAERAPEGTLGVSDTHE